MYGLRLLRSSLGKQRKLKSCAVTMVTSFAYCTSRHPSNAGGGGGDCIFYLCIVCGNTFYTLNVMLRRFDLPMPKIDFYLSEARHVEGSSVKKASLH